VKESIEKVEKQILREEASERIKGQALLKDHEIAEVKKADKIVKACFNSETKQIIPHLMRPSGFLLIASPLAFLMVSQKSRSIGSISQLLTQAYLLSLYSGNTSAS
jgi:Sideroflexins